MVSMQLTTPSILHSLIACIAFGRIAYSINASAIPIRSQAKVNSDSSYSDPEWSRETDFGRTYSRLRWPKKAARKAVRRAATTKRTLSSIKENESPIVPSPLPNLILLKSPTPQTDAEATPKPESLLDLAMKTVENTETIKRALLSIDKDNGSIMLSPLKLLSTNPPLPQANAKPISKLKPISTAAMKALERAGNVESSLSLAEQDENASKPASSEIFLRKAPYNRDEHAAGFGVEQQSKPSEPLSGNESSKGTECILYYLARDPHEPADANREAHDDPHQQDVGTGILARPLFKLDGSYIVDEHLKSSFHEQFEPLDKKIDSEFLSPLAEEKSLKRFGIRATISLALKEPLFPFKKTMLSGDRVIIARSMPTPETEKRSIYRLEAYDVMTSTVLFSTRHTSTGFFEAYASSCLIVVVERAVQSRKHYKALSTVTVYERIDEKSAEKNTIFFSTSVVGVKISDDSSKIVFSCAEEISFIFLKGKGFFVSQSNVTLGDKWLIGRVYSQNDGAGLIAFDTSTGTLKLLFNCLDTEVTLSKDTLIWAENDRNMHVIKMLDLNQGDFTPRRIGTVSKKMFLEPLRMHLFGDFAKTRLLTLIDGDGSIGLLNVDLKIFTKLHPNGPKEFSVASSCNSPILLLYNKSNPAESNLSVVHLKDSSMSDYMPNHLYCDAFRAIPKHAKSTKVFDYLLQHVYTPLPAPFIRLTALPVERGRLSTFDENLIYHYAVTNSFVIRRKAINCGDGQSSIKLPIATIRGRPRCLQRNSSGTVFYVATKTDVNHFIYIFNIVDKKIHQYRLANIYSKDTIDRMHVYSDGKILEVNLGDQRTLIFTCKHRHRLRLVYSLKPMQKVVNANEIAVVFQDCGRYACRTGYIVNLDRAKLKVGYLFESDVYIALDEKNLYVKRIRNKNIVVARLNVETGKATAIKNHNYTHLSHVRFSKIHNGIIQIIDFDFFYRLVNLKTFKQLYKVQLVHIDSPRNTVSHISVSSDGRRIIVFRPGEMQLAEIFDPKFPLLYAQSENF